MGSLVVSGSSSSVSCVEFDFDDPRVGYRMVLDQKSNIDKTWAFQKEQHLRKKVSLILPMLVLVVWDIELTLDAKHVD